MPTYNERENVESMCRQLLSLNLDADILFMDDHSPDGTGDILDGLARANDRVFVAHRAGKLGIGSAHQEGIAWAYDRRYPILVTMDCDFTHSPSDIPTLLKHLEGHDVAVGSRYLQEGSLADWNLLRKSLTRFGHFLTKRLLKIQYDATGAFRAYRLTAIPEALFRLVPSRGYAFFLKACLFFRRTTSPSMNCPLCCPSGPMVIPRCA